MFELKITAATIEELMAKASALGALGATTAILSLDVPLPEPKLSSPAELAKARRGRPPKAQAEPEEAMHASQPEPVAMDTPISADALIEDRPTETASAPLAEVEPATSETAPPASDDGQEALGSGQSPQAEVQTAPASDQGDIPDYMRDGPSTIEQAQAELDAGGPEDEWPDDFRDFTEIVDTGATTFTEIKKAQSVFFNSETFKTMAPEIQNRLRANIWTTCIDRKEQGTLTGVPDVFDDVSAFRLALETWTDPEAISGTYAMLQKGDAWSRTPPTARETIDKAVQIRLGAV